MIMLQTVDLPEAVPPPTPVTTSTTHTQSVPCLKTHNLQSKDEMLLYMREIKETNWFTYQ
jgi:hypothetical protein